MYKLKKLELLGFKSFGDRTRLEFADGVAAIVGPNGCGKSNLSDAITWVLGEQSARLLRGERMADVIFNGTGTRPATSLGEVSMTLIDPEYSEAGLAPDEAEPASPEPTAQAAGPQNGDGSSHATPEEESLQAAGAAGPQNGNGSSAATKPAGIRHRAGEITVTRRLFRSGESEYLLNGEICRLRDIQDLFMGTGLGPESYAIIEQGRIGQVLSSKPSDRRLILEEAAGVSKFKTRKRLAEAKLESSRQNLARITDILEEVTKQVNSLKRQASKARRYKELHGELRARLKVVLTSRLKALEATCAELRENLARAQETAARAAEALAALEQQQKSASLRHEEVESRLTELRQKLAEADLERERHLSRVEQARQQTATLQGRAVEASQEAAQCQEQLRRLEEESRALALEEEQLRHDWKAARETLNGLLARQEALSAQVRAAESEAESCRAAVLQAVSQAAELRNQLVQAEESGLALERQAARAQAESSRVEAEHARLASELKAFLDASRRDTGHLKELTESAERAATELQAAKTEEASRRSELENLRRDYSASLARQQTLEESLARHAYGTESVRRLLAGEIPMNGHRFRPLGLLADFVEVSPGYEEVVEDFLKQELECVVVERHEQARSGIELLRSEGTGRSTFYVTHLASNGHSNGHADTAVRGEPGVVASVKDLVRFASLLGLNGDVALPSLANAFLVEDAAAAERLAGAYPDCHFLTRRGEHYHHRLVSGGKGPSAGPLALRRDFRELERRTSELANTLRASEAALSDVAERAARLAGKVTELSAARVEAEKKALVAHEKQRQAREASERAEDQLQTLRSESAALQRDRDAVEQRLAGLRAALKAASLEKAQREDALLCATQTLRDQRAGLDRLAQELVEAQARASALEEKTRAAEAESSRHRSMAEEVRGRRVRLEQQIEGWREEQARLGQESESLQARLLQLEIEREEARRELGQSEEACLALKAQRDALGPQVDAARTEVEACREKRSEVEVALARAESEQTYHAQQCREELSAEPAALLAELTPESALAGEALQTAEEELREIKTRLENLGPVNMMALEELQEAEERFTFLETQRQDLLSSIEDTAQAIREIDQVSRQQFLEAFTAINSYFAESFRALFGGGVGQMRLTDENDPDSGIDIAAQPPGKRLQNVLLLSGGEKAMAALALLIAIFRYTPSPFCILDEVDAPLDESNIERFTKMIQHLSRHTQFILITHNRRTMEIARVMYGVTMEEPGVSKLVSVRFEARERELEAVPA